MNTYKSKDSEEILTDIETMVKSIQAPSNPKSDIFAAISVSKEFAEKHGFKHGHIISIEELKTLL